MNLFFTKALSTDYSELDLLQKDAFKSAIATLNGAGCSIVELRSINELTKDSNISLDFYKITLHEKIVGGAYIRKLDNLTCEFYRIFVAPDLHRNGCGSFIINSVIEKYKECTVFVAETPAALERNLNFYTKNKFEMVGRHTHKEVELIKLRRKVERFSVTGLTPSYNGLHLGHFIGNIAPILATQNDYNSTFVLADWQVLNSNIEYYNRKVLEENMRLMIKQLLAFGINPAKVKIVQESKIKRERFDEFIYLCDFVTCQRISRLPLIKNLTNRGTVKMSLYTYPLLQALDIIGANADIVFSNDDNRPCIELINELFKRINAYGIKEYKVVKFITGKVKLLVGTDGKKMSKAKKNCIFLTDNDSQIQEKILRIPSSSDMRSSAVFQYLRAFASEREYNDIVELYLNKDIQDLQVKKRIILILSDLFQQYKSAFDNIDDKLVEDILFSK